MASSTEAVRTQQSGTYGRSAYKVGEPLPLVLLLEDIAAILGVGTPRAWQLERAGELRTLECLPRLGGRPRYSGKKVQAWVDGDGFIDEQEESPSRYFQAGRKAGRR